MVDWATHGSVLTSRKVLTEARRSPSGSVPVVSEAAAAPALPDVPAAPQEY